MTESDSALPFPLPDDLDRALQQATDRTLESLAVLRRTLREHVRSERKNGVSLTELEVRLRALVARAEAEAQSTASREERSGKTLSEQVLVWSGRYFNQVD